MCGFSSGAARSHFGRYWKVHTVAPSTFPTSSFKMGRPHFLKLVSVIDQNESNLLYNFRFQIETIGDAYCVAGGIHKRSKFHAQQIAWMAIKMMKVAMSEKAHDGSYLKVNIYFQMLIMFYLLRKMAAPVVTCYRLMILTSLTRLR